MHQSIVIFFIETLFGRGYFFGLCGMAAALDIIEILLPSNVDCVIINMGIFRYQTHTMSFGTPITNMDRL